MGDSRMQINEAKLGEKLVEVRPGRKFFIFVIGFSLLLTLCGTVSFLSNFAQEKGQADAIVAAVFFLLGLVGVGIGYQKVVLRQTSLAAYENGVVKVRNLKSTTIFWQEVPYLWRSQFEMQQKKTRGFGHQIRTLTTWRLRDVHQKEISLENFEQIGKIAEEKVWPRIWAEIVALVGQGETAVFGPVSINKEGMTHKDQFVRWSEIADVEFGRNVRLILANDKKKSWKEAITLQIPNLPLLKRFIDEAHHIP